MEEPNFETTVLVELKGIDGKLDTLIKSSEDHEGRLRKLEFHRGILTGVALVVSPTIAVVAQRVIGA